MNTLLSYREIFEVLDLMRMDMANFTIQQIRPYIQQQSVDYEKKKFEEFLQKQQRRCNRLCFYAQDLISRHLIGRFCYNCLSVSLGCFFVVVFFSSRINFENYFGDIFSTAFKFVLCFQWPSTFRRPQYC